MEKTSPRKPKIGLALGSGAARGWAHIGVLEALSSLGIEVDVYAGCSSGALVAGAHLIGQLDRLKDWAQSIGPTDALTKFRWGIARGGFINPEKAFDQFADADRPIANLPSPFGAVATNLATGREVWLTAGSTLAACRASSAIPLVFQAVRHTVDGKDMWLVDGAVSNPVPVSLARALGADRIIAVDLNACPSILSRFDGPDTREVVAVEPSNTNKNGTLTGNVETFIKHQTDEFSRRMALAKARSNARPQLFETTIAIMDTVQMQLAKARTQEDVPDILLTPDLSAGNAAAFDKWKEFSQSGYDAVIAAKDEIVAVCSKMDGYTPWER